MRKLSIIGGKGGILAVSGTDICKATQIAEQEQEHMTSSGATFISLHVTEAAHV